ncbi:putative inositol transporter 3 [Choanephora cucurbitarum]|uniref:Putative inositol transporter 3 n=1 Tax=Choanephora cucurbitarum TaxID=101091 RepID=A0A1C7NSM2_9FUNG|nr:putative inositol transporter 3 [Choanephora cucurbitarum]
MTRRDYETLSSSEQEEALLLNSNTEQKTTYVYFLVFSVCLSGFLFGYDTGVISGALQPLEKDFALSVHQKEWVVGSTTMGAVIGGFLAGLCSDKLGRKPLVLSAAVVFILGSILLSIATQYGTLVLGRLIVGFGVGMASMIVPVYISEIAPKSFRGQLATLNTLVVTIGQVSAYIVNIVYSDTHSGWRYMFGLGAVPALLQLCLLPFLPESPRQDVANHQIAAAKETFRKIYSASISDDFIDHEISAIEEDRLQSSQSTYRVIFSDQQNRKPLLIACLLQAAQQLSGFNTAMYYAATILQMAGFKSHQNSTSVALIVAVTNMVFTLLAVRLIDKSGRRRILLTTMVCMILCLLVLGAAFAVQQQGLIPQQSQCLDYGSNCARCLLDDRCGWTDKDQTCIDRRSIQSLVLADTCPRRSMDGLVTAILLTSLTSFVASYALGLGYVPWVVQSELFSLSIRGKANGLATATNWLCNLLVSSTFLSITNAISAAGTFWLYACISTVLWFNIYRYLPETSGKSLEDISALFAKDTFIYT